MSDGYCSGTISEICNIEYGTRVVRRIDEGTKYPVYGGGGETFKVDNYNRENRMIISRFAMSETAVRFVSGRFFLNDSGLTVSPKNSSAIIDEFLNYLLLSLNETIYRLGRGTAQKNLNMDEFKNLKICFPRNLESQKRTVAILDKVFAKLDEVKEILEKQLLNAEEMIQSYLNSLLSNESSKWPEFALDEYVQFIDYRGRTPEKTKNGVRLITAKNVRMGFLKYEPAEFIAAEDYDEWMRRGIPEYGDVIFTTEAPLANVAQINTHEKLAFAQRIIIMHPDTSIILQDFLKYLLLSQSIRNKIFEKESGATVTGIKAKLLKKIEIPVPEISAQKEIVNKLDKAVSHINSLKESYSHKLTCVEELRKSILDKAFRGELLK